MDDFLAFSRIGYQDSGIWAFLLLQNPPSLPQVTVTFWTPSPQTGVVYLLHHLTVA